MRQRCVIVSAFLLAQVCFPLTAEIYEAENGKLLGQTKVDNTKAGFSGSGYVTGFSSPESSAELQIQAPEAGFYRLMVRYTASAEKWNPVFVNDSLQGSLFFPRAEEFSLLKTGRVRMEKGANRIRFGSDWGYIDLDSVELVPAEAATPFKISENLVTPNASAEASALFKKLGQAFTRGTLLGQQEQDHGGRIKWIEQQTGGAKPVLLGLDFLNYSGAYNRPDGQLEEALAWHKNGGLVTFSWHWFSPFGGKEPIWKSFGTKETTFDASKVADPESKEYAAIVRDLDLIAEQLKILRDAGVPVLWRPLHEAEGGWFWWGAFGPETAKKLYRLMFERFTKMHGLNNLIWVWTTTDSPAALEWYPGDDVVDIIGPDIYPRDGEHGTFAMTFDNLRTIFGGRKPIALCETSTLIEGPELVADKATWLWLLVWDDYIQRPKVNPIEVIRRVFQ